MKPHKADTLLKATKDLVAIPSTADNPAALQAAYDYMLDFVRNSCKDITIEEFESGGKPSFLAYRGATRPDRFRIILSGHVDVVPGTPEQYKLRIKDDKLYGRGVYDMKAACIILAQVFAEFVHKVPYPLALQIVTDEESAGKDCALYQVQQGVRADFVICGESGRHANVYEIANETKGFVIADVELYGTAAHSAYPWLGDNAAVRAAEFSRKLHEHYPVPGEATTGTIISVTSIEAVSGAHSRIPDRGTVKLMIRYQTGDPDFADRQTFRELMKRIDPEVHTIIIHEFCPPIYTSPNNPLIQCLRRSAEQVERATFSYVQRQGTGDGRFFCQVGSEACEFGIAGENSHGDDEYITLQAFDNYLETMRLFMQESVTVTDTKLDTVSETVYN